VVADSQARPRSQAFRRHLDELHVRRRVHRIYGDKIVAEHYAPARLLWHSRTCAWRLAEAEEASVPMPSVNVVRDRLLTGICARLRRSSTGAALGLIAAEEAGLAADASIVVDAGRYFGALQRKARGRGKRLINPATVAANAVHSLVGLLQQDWNNQSRLPKRAEAPRATDHCHRR